MPIKNGRKKDESKDFRLFLKDILFHHQNGPRAHTRLYMEIHQISVTSLACWLPSYNVGEILWQCAYFLQSNEGRIWNEMTG